MVVCAVVFMVDFLGVVNRLWGEFSGGFFGDEEFGERRFWGLIGLFVGGFALGGFCGSGGFVVVGGFGVFFGVGGGWFFCGFGVGRRCWGIGVVGRGFVVLFPPGGESVGFEELGAEAGELFEAEGGLFDDVEVLVGLDGFDEGVADGGGAS